MCYKEVARLLLLTFCPSGLPPVDSMIIRYKDCCLKMIGGFT
jgi:hypothetical protein